MDLEIVVLNKVSEVPIDAVPPTNCTGGGVNDQEKQFTNILKLLVLWGNIVILTLLAHTICHKKGSKRSYKFSVEETIFK